MIPRNVTDKFLEAAYLDSTPVAEENPDPERFRLYRLCPCGECRGKGKVASAIVPGVGMAEKVGETRKCKACRGEGRALELVATCGTPEAVGVALVTLGREGEWAECPVGVLDTAGQKNEKWVLSPWLPSARNISDAGRLLRAQR